MGGGSRQYIMCVYSHEQRVKGTDFGIVPLKRVSIWEKNKRLGIKLNCFVHTCIHNLNYKVPPLEVQLVHQKDTVTKMGVTLANMAENSFNAYGWW